MNENFSEVLQEILNLPVSPENIGEYENAITANLVNLVNDVGIRYGHEENITPVAGAEFEDAAFDKFGLPSLESVLNDLQSKIDMVRQAGRFLTEKAVEIESVITPPDESPFIKIENGSGEFTPAGIKNRVQTALYVLQKLGLDLDTVTLTRGQITRNMMRRTSYQTVEISELGKVLQICDEEGNASYIFLSHVMAEIGISVELLNDLTKDEKNELIRAYGTRGLGRRFVYTPGWVDELETLLQANDADMIELAQQSEDFRAHTAENRSFKAPVAPEGFMATGPLAKELGIAHKTLMNIIEREGILLDLYLFSPRTVSGVPPVIQDLIRGMPELRIERALEDVVSVKEFAKSVGVARETLDKIIHDSNIPTPIYKFHTKPAPGISLKDQETIKQILMFRPPQAGDGVVSVEKFAQSHKLTRGKITEILSELGIKAETYKFRTRSSPGLTTDQQETLLQHHELSVPVAPPEVVSLSKLGHELNSSIIYITGLVEELGIEADEYKFHTRIALGLNPEQHTQVLELFAKHRPQVEGSVSLHELYQETGISYPRIRGILSKMGITLIDSQRRDAKRKTSVGKAVPAEHAQAVREVLKQELTANGNT